MNLLDAVTKPVDISIRLEGEDNRGSIEVKTDSGNRIYLLYHDGEDVKGTVSMKVKPGKKIDHQGIKIELMGQVELYYDRGNTYEFISLVRELAPIGILEGDQSFPFEFNSVEKPYESHNGISVRLRYFLRVTIVRSLLNMSKERELWVQNLNEAPTKNEAINMEVGIEDKLHIMFTYNHEWYNLRDVVIGKVTFIMVKLKVKHMEIALIKRETTGSGPTLYNESETVTKFEIMDGDPVKGEIVPVRMYLGAFDLTPIYKTVNNKFSVKYFLNLVIVDQDDKRFFKQQEIKLWRKDYYGQIQAANSTPSDIQTLPDHQATPASIDKAKKAKKATSKSNLDEEETAAAERAQKPGETTATTTSDESFPVGVL